MLLLIREKFVYHIPLIRKYTQYAGIQTLAATKKNTSNINERNFDSSMIIQWK